MVRQGIEFTLSGDAGRAHRIGAIGARHDGTIVKARNEKTRIPTPCAHAEARLVNKLGMYAPLVIVLRVSKQHNGLAMAKPCPDCENALRQHKVQRVLYSDDDGELKVLW